MKKILSLFLTFAMLVSFVPICASAAELPGMYSMRFNKDTYVPGDTISVTVSAAAANLAATVFRVYYDSSKVIYKGMWWQRKNGQYVYDKTPRLYYDDEYDDIDSQRYDVYVHNEEEHLVGFGLFNSDAEYIKYLPNDNLVTLDFVVKNNAFGEASFSLYEDTCFYEGDDNNFRSNIVTTDKSVAVKNVIGVKKTDIDNIASNIESDLNKLLSKVTLCDTTIKGPVFDVLGKKFCPIEFNAKAVLDFSGLSKNITIDEENKKVHVMLGKKQDGNSSIVQTTKTCDASWSKQYKEIKDLYKSMTGFTASGSDRNGVNNWNKFEKMKGQLNRMQCDMFIKASMECVAYLDFDYQTGYLRLSEGGFIESASLGVDIKHGSVLYVLMGLTGSENGTIKATVNADGTWNPYMSIKPAITAKAAIGANIVGAKAEGSIDATLGVLLQTSKPNLSVDMSGKISLDIRALNHTLYSNSWPYLNVQLYPEFKQLSLLKEARSYTDVYSEAILTPRDYLNGVSLLALGGENAVFECNNVYPDNDAQLLRLPGNAMMLVWTGDDGTKSDINRTSLMFSVYKDGVWSEVRKIAEDGTATGYFKAVSDGEMVYVVYQKLSSVLSDDVSVEETLSLSEIYMVQYQDGDFGEPVLISNYENSSYESVVDVSLEGSKLKIAWIENTENDIFLSEGTTYAKFVETEKGVIGDVVTVYETNAAENKYPGDVHITDDKVYYTIYSVSENDTTATLNCLSNGISEKIIEGENITNIRNIGNTLYYVKNSSIYKFENGSEEDLGYNSITSFDIVSNGKDYAMIMTVSDGAKNELYISKLENGEWTKSERFTDLDKYIRSFSPFMYDDGTVNTAVSVAEVNETIEEGTPTYGNTSIMVLNQCDYFDISTSYAYYDDESIKPNGIMNLYFDVYNDCADVLESVIVTVTDENGEVVDKQTIECKIAPYSAENLNIQYRLPETITKTQIALTVSTEREEKDIGNNTVKTEYGYSNVCVNPIEYALKNNNTAEISAPISNIGFDDAENVIIKVCNNSLDGDILYEEKVGALAVGETYKFNYTFPTEKMVSADKDALNAVYVVAETSSVESIYSDNDQKSVFESLNCKVNDIDVKDGKAVVNVTKNSVDKAVLVLATYSGNDNLVEVQYKDISTTDDVKFVLKDTNAVKFSAFVWEDINKMTPISNNYSKVIE